jgi:hypothetical protein
MSAVVKRCFWVICSSTTLKRSLVLVANLTVTSYPSLPNKNFLRSGPDVSIINKQLSLLPLTKVVPWLRRLVAGLSQRWPGFAPRSIPVNIIPPWAPHFRKLKKHISFIHSPLHSSSSGDGQKARKSGRSPVRRQSHPHNQNTEPLTRFVLMKWCLTR